MINQRIVLLTASVALTVTLSAQQQTDGITLTLAEATPLLLANCPELAAQEAEVRVAEGELLQSQAWDNPVVTVMHNVNNPVTHRYFEWGREGETDVQLSQRIFIGGQHRHAVRRNTSLYSSAQAALETTRREQIAELHATMIELDELRQKTAFYESQAEVLRKIMTAYAPQQDKGNVSPMEVTRIGGMLFMTQQELYENAVEMSCRQVRLKQMLGLSSDIIPVLEEPDHDSICALLLTDARAAERSDVRSLSLGAEAALHEIHLQKSNALPEVSLMGEWDKNGNIGRNFFAVGLSLTLPIFNRNQGNVRSAKARQQQAEVQYRQAVRSAEAEVERLEQQLRSQQAVTGQHDILAVQKTLMEQVAQQYMKRNISLLEFTAHMESCQQVMLAAVKGKASLRKTIVELKKAKGL